MGKIGYKKGYSLLQWGCRRLVKIKCPSNSTNMLAIKNSNILKTSCYVQRLFTFVSYLKQNYKLVILFVLGDIESRSNELAHSLCLGRANIAYIKL